MVLTLERKSQLLKNPGKACDLIVFDAKDIKFTKNRETFGWCMELLLQKRHCILANTVFQKLGSDKVIDGEIVYKAIESILKGTPFNETDIKAYYQFKMDLEGFFEINEEFVSCVRYTAFIADYFLLGAKIDLEFDDIPHELNMDYEGLLISFFWREVDLSTFIKQAKAAIGKYFNF